MLRIEEDGDLKEMCREEIESFTSEMGKKSEDIYSSLISSQESSPPQVQTVVFSIHTVKQEGGLESGITVRHMAEFYEKFFEYHDWEILSYKEVPYGGSNTKTQGDPMELVQFTVQGEGALEILAREKVR